MVNEDGGLLRKVIFGTLGITGFMLLMGGFYTVDQGERAVVLRNGAIIGSEEPGLHFKVPMIDRVAFISVQSQKEAFEKMTAYSKDQQPAEMEISVNFHVTPAQVTEVYASYGSLENMVERVLKPGVLKASKEVFGQYTAASAIQDRQKLGVDVLQSIEANTAGKMTVESVQVENIDYSDAYEQSVEQRMLAEVEVQKIRQNWEQEKVAADITRTKAQAEADAKLAQAQAEAKAIEMRGNAEAAAIQAKGAALRDNPGLVQLIQAERWNGQLPTTMVPGGAVPFVSIK